MCNSSAHLVSSNKWLLGRK